MAKSRNVRWDIGRDIKIGYTFKNDYLRRFIIKQRGYYHNPYRKQLLGKIDSLNDQVFTREDLGLAKSNQAQLQLNRALKVFIEEGHITKISHGLYAKATQMHFSDGKTMSVLKASFESVAIEALNKLGVNWEFGQAIQAYNRGDTTQVPAVFSVKLHSRFRGKIQAEGRVVMFEGGINAR